MKTVRIFISSPGDVAEERDRARQVVEQLRRRYVGKIELKSVLWEDLPLQADMSFQQGIDMVLSMEQGIDIAVFILWSRLGSPLGSLILKPDGSSYRSGTEREFDLVMAARRQSGSDTPKVLVYRRIPRVFALPHALGQCRRTVANRRTKARATNSGQKNSATSRNLFTAE